MKRFELSRFSLAKSYLFPISTVITTLLDLIITKYKRNSDLTNEIVHLLVQKPYSILYRLIVDITISLANFLVYLALLINKKGGSCTTPISYKITVISIVLLYTLFINKVILKFYNLCSVPVFNFLDAQKTN